MLVNGSIAFGYPQMAYERSNVQNGGDVNSAGEKNTAMEILLRSDKQMEEMTMSSIEGKLRSGKKLSPIEMDYLRRNNAALYEKAKMIEQEREEYKQKLKNCRTKEQAQQVYSHAAMAIADGGKSRAGSGLQGNHALGLHTAGIPVEKGAEASQADDFAQMRMAAIDDEHKETAPRLQKLSLTEEQDNRLRDQFSKAEEDFFGSAVYKNKRAGQTARLGENPDTPFGRVLTSYVADKPFMAPDGKNRMFRYRDMTTDEQCPGRFAVNGGSGFFQEAAELYAKDHRFLDDSRSWLHGDVGRYVNDLAKFLHASDVAGLDDQIKSYIRYLGGDGKASEAFEFTVDGVSFEANELIDTLSFLKDTLHAETRNPDGQQAETADFEKCKQAVERYLSQNLNEEQRYLISGSQDNWLNYNAWAEMYGHDSQFFAYR